MRSAGRIAAAVAGAALLIALTGCTPSGSNGTAVAAGDALAGIAGLRSTSVDVETFGDGHDIAVTAFIEDGYTVQKPEQFAEYLLKLAWSVDDTKPDQGLILTVVPGADGDFNIADALADGGWVEPAKDPDPLVIFIAPDQLNSMDKLGTWPGPSPKLPAGTLAKR